LLGVVHREDAKQESSRRQGVRDGIIQHLWRYTSVQQIKSLLASKTQDNYFQEA
jgi:hypothetical protein